MSEEPKTSPPSPPDAKRVKERSPSYPAISLRKALELSQKFWDSDNRQAVMVVRAALNLGFTAKSSAGALALAAMKKYGLLEEAGNGDARKVKLTENAINILNPSFPTRKDLIKTVALKPRIHADLWNKFGVTGASEGVVNDYLIFEKKFFKDAAKSLIATYTDTIKLAELTVTDKVENVDDGGSDDDDDDRDTKLPPLLPPDAGKPKGQFTPPPPPPPPGKQNPPALNPTIKYFAIPTDIGDAHIPMGMSEEDFTLFGAALKLFKGKIVKASRYPVGAIWRNADHDKPVTIVGEMGERDGVKYYHAQGDDGTPGTGIPENELTFAS